MSSELSVSQARERLGEVVSRVEHAYERAVLTRHGRPVAAVVSMEDLRALEDAEDAADLAAAREALKEPRVSQVDVLADLGLIDS